MARKKQVQAGDGWTVVAGSSSSNSNNTSAKAQESDSSTTHNTPQSTRPPNSVAGLTMDKLGAEYATMEKRWKATSCSQTLSKMLRLHEWRVERAVCIGIGSFSRDWEHRYRSLWQLVLFRSVVGILQKDDSATITLYAQEPAFTPVDIAFLATLSMTVVASSIETHIAPETFVYAPFVDWFLLLPVFLKGRDPRLYVGNEILAEYGAFANTRQKKGVLGECDRVGGAFVVGRERRRVPEFELHGNALEGLMVYWREDDDDDDDDD